MHTLLLPCHSLRSSIFATSKYVSKYNFYKPHDPLQYLVISTVPLPSQSLKKFKMWPLKQDLKDDLSKSPSRWPSQLAPLSHIWYIALTQNVSSFLSSSSLTKTRISTLPGLILGANLIPIVAVSPPATSNLVSLNCRRSSRLVRKKNTFLFGYGLVYEILLLHPFPPPTGSINSNALDTVGGRPFTHTNQLRTNWWYSISTTLM